MKAGPATCSTLVFLFVLGCGNDLTRPIAAELIASNDKFKLTTDVHVTVGRFWYDFWSFEGDFGWLPALSEQGIVTHRKTGRFHMGDPEHEILLTSSGEEAALTWTKTTRKVPSIGFGAFEEPSPHAVIYAIPIATRELVDVTGIVAEPESNSVDAEFQWKWVLNAHSKLVPTRLPEVSPKLGSATFQLYDDGWRLIDIDLKQ